MKHGKKLTREMKMLLEKNGYIPYEYLYVKNKNDKIEFLHKENGNILWLEK
jgi:hypothetical protein